VALAGPRTIILQVKANPDISRPLGSATLAYAAECGSAVKNFHQIILRGLLPPLASGTRRVPEEYWERMSGFPLLVEFVLATPKIAHLLDRMPGIPRRRSCHLTQQLTAAHADRIEALQAAEAVSSKLCD
jgi:hypothetical protein